MIRLSNMHRFKPKERIFYFHTIEDCNEFLNVFKENECNVHWTEPREIPNNVKIKNMERNAMDKSPVERAKNALSWGFEITGNQYSFFKG